MADLEITFKSRAELEGAKQFATELERNIGKMKAMGQDANEASAKLSRLNDSIKESETTLKAETRTKEQSDVATEKLTTSKVRLREVVKGLAVEFPVLARVIGFAVNPVTLLAGALSLSLGALQKWMQGISEAGRQQTEYEAIRTNVTSLARLTAQYTKELDEMAKASGSASSGADQLNRELDEQLQIQEKLAQKRLEAAKAEIQLKVARGELTEAGGAEAIQHLEGRASAESGKREMDVALQKLTNLQNALSQLDKELAGVKGVSPGELARLAQESKTQEGLAARAQTDLARDEVAITERIHELEAERVAGAGGIFSVQRTYGDFFKRGRGLTPQERMAQIDEDIATEQRLLQAQRLTTEDRLGQSDRAKGAFGDAEGRARRRAELLGQRGAILGDIESSRSGVERLGLFQEAAGPLDARTRAATSGAAGAREAGEVAKNLERAVQRELQHIKSSAKTAGQSIEETGSATRELLERLVRDNQTTLQRVRQLESQRNAGR